MQSTFESSNRRVNMKTKCSIIGLFVLNAISLSYGAIKIWQRDNDIRNPRHWVGEGPQKDCHGLVLNWVDTAIVLDNDLELESLTLPDWADIILDDNWNLTFSEHSNDLMNCVVIKNEPTFKAWMDVENWITSGEENNVAIPDIERVPCKYDEVVFPKGIRGASCMLPSWPLVIHRLKIGNEYWTNADIDHLFNNIGAPFVSSHSTSIIALNEQECESPSGCRCGLERENYDVCIFIEEDRPINCTDPIQVIGFCTRICGASILLKPVASIHHIKSMLKDYTVDTYVSRVLNGSEDAIQIVFAEKEFDGTSLDEATDLHNQLPKEYHPELYLSGPYYKEGEALRSTLSIVFGSLCGVALVFGLIFLVNSNHVIMGNIRNRLNFNVGSLSSYTSNVFAKYDNSDRVGLFSEGQSIAGSIMNLSHSFDNPSYGKETTVSPSTSTDTVDLNKEDDVEE